ncbi:MAG: hypothetical protein AAF211_06470 [Myxococcota bacterium]
MELPDRDEASEDAFVTWASALDDAEPLVLAIEAAMDARRPRLAARLVGLVGDHVEIEPGSALDRARTAARLLVMGPEEPEVWAELENAWRDAHARRIWRMKERVRRTLSGSTERIGRWDSRRRRR